MKIIVLGAAAGGGFPQWNAASTTNRAAFARDANHPQLTQTSLAVSDGGENWLLLNAAPDIRQQILATPELHPNTAPRSSPINAVVVTGADVDALTGLLTLRERQPFTLWATPYVHNVIAASAIFGVLDEKLVNRKPIEGPFAPLPGLTAYPLPAPGKPPLYLERIEGLADVAGASIGLRLTSGSGKSAVFLPACAEVTPDVVRAIDGADILFFDGTMYTDDEMIRTGEGAKTARRMGHVAMIDAIEALRGVKVGRRYFIHVNNSNPVLNRASAERKSVQAAGWLIAEDGMRIEL